MYIPDRGDIVMMHFSPQSGHEQDGHRPAVVLSPAFFNEKSMCAFVCPITRQSKGYPFEVDLDDTTETTGVILADHLNSIDIEARQIYFKEKLPNQITEKCIRKIHRIMPIDPEEL